MKVSFIAIVGAVAFVSAQQVPNLPSCGTTAMISAVSSSGCAFTDATCMCKNKAVVEAATKQIPKSCGPPDQKLFADFFNSQCTGQPGFPITIGQSASAKPAAGGSDTGSGSEAPSASGVKPSSAITSGAPKPSSAGAAGAKLSSASKITEVSIGVVAAAAVFALFGMS